MHVGTGKYPDTPSQYGTSSSQHHGVTTVWLCPCARRKWILVPVCVQHGNMLEAMGDVIN